MKVAWKDYWQVQQRDSITRGYVNFARSIRSILLPIIDNSSSVPIVIHAAPAHIFEPEPGRFNVLFSMWEGPRLVESFIEKSKLADLLVVPSHFCRRVWEKEGFQAEVVPLGIDPALSGIERQEGEKIRFLFLASPVTRKGWHLVADAFAQAFRYYGEDVELYVKMITPQNRVWRPKPWMILDGRDLGPAGLRQLYAESHIFVFPSFLEGFGLPALEAMAAGCLVVSTDVGGLKDFVDDDVAVVIGRNQILDLKYGVPFRARVPSARDLQKALVQARSRWGTPELEKRRRAGRKRASSYTWRRTVDELLGVIRDAYGAAA